MTSQPYFFPQSLSSYTLTSLSLLHGACSNCGFNYALCFWPSVALFSESVSVLISLLRWRDHKCTKYPRCGWIIGSSVLFSHSKWFIPLDLFLDANWALSWRFHGTDSYMYVEKWEPTKRSDVCRTGKDKVFWEYHRSLKAVWSLPAWRPLVRETNRQLVVSGR